MIVLTKSVSAIRNANFVSPNEFLEWARKDLEQKDRRAIGNTIGNLKKAIHGRMDEIINTTHIKYCNDWNQKATTEIKLKVLNILGMKYSSVVALLTTIRNVYEHKYRIIEYNKSQAYFEIAEMWLTGSYRDYSFNKLAIKGLKTKQFGIHSGKNGIRIKELEFEKKFDFDYLWESKKEIHEVKNGKLKVIPMNTVDWETMLKYEAKHGVFSNASNKIEYTLPARALTNIYNKAKKHLI